jgi:hypothetical protein
LVDIFSTLGVDTITGILQSYHYLPIWISSAHNWQRLGLLVVFQGSPTAPPLPNLIPTEIFEAEFNITHYEEKHHKGKA